jgi:purine nucleosidase
MPMGQTPLYPGLEAGQSQSDKFAVFIDTDIGDDIDDAFALALALRSPEIELLGVTTVFGNTQRRAQLAAHLLHVFGRDDVPVAAGIATPLYYRHKPSGVPQAAVLDEGVAIPELCSLSGPELIVQTARAHVGRLILICIGPLTNIALALTIEPQLFRAIRRIIMMGGTSSIPFPEWNVRSDALAAQKVLAAGIPVTMLGWNVTTRCQLRESDIAQLRSEGSAQTHLLSQLLAIWQWHRPCWHPKLPYLHDPLTIAALCAPEFLRFEEITVRALVHGPLQGFMVPRVMDGPLVHAAVRVDAKRARAWIMRRLLSPGLHSPA